LTPSFIPHILISIRFKEASVMIHDRKSALLFGTVIAIVLLVAASPAAAQTKLLRFPAIHGDKIAFTYAGDIWIAPAAGGTAARLTAHPGMEVFPRFSPDGKWIAFTGQYDGDEQVYVMPSTGGEPKQLTYYPARGPLAPRWGWDNQVYGWTNDGQSILFRSQRDSWTAGEQHLYTVAMTGGPAEVLPMPVAGAGDYSADGTKMVYSPRYRDFRPEKRYGGGQANDLWLFDLKTNDAKRIIAGPRADRDPMWISNTVYYTADTDGTFNIYAYDVASGKTTQVTKNTIWDVRWPSSDRAGRIVYEQNGELQVLDVKTGKSSAVAINVPDDGLWKRPSRVPASGQLEDFELSPKGERALFSARGDIFTAPVEKGATRNLTHSSGAHDKRPCWSPDGSKIAFISDISGEEELTIIDQDGKGKPERLTTGSKAMLFQPVWSPDGKRIAFADKDNKIFVYSFADKKLTEIVDAPRGMPGDYTWSPRDHFLAFSMMGNNGFNAIHIWSEKDGKLRKITDGLFNAENPAWDPDGDYLFYLSDREFAPQISTMEFNFATNRTTGIFAMALRKDVKHPFPPESDEVALKEEKAAAAAAPLAPAAKAAPAATVGKTGAPAAAAKADAGEPADLVIDFDGLGKRVARIPLDADNYGGLAAKKGHLLYIVGPAGYYGRAPEKRAALKIYSIKDRKETTLVEDAGGYALSADGSKVIAASGGSFFVLDAGPGGAGAKKPVSTAGLMVDRVPVEEWNQIFNEVWRRYRDFFYVENMHGYDWEALKKQYAPLLRYVAHRSDLNYVITEMISELTVQHAYIEGGDFTIPPRPRVALPGARFELDKAAGRYRIKTIFSGDNEEPAYRAPLTEIGIDVAAGDYLLAVDGVELSPNEDPYRQLRNKADRPVQLTVSSKPSFEGARTVSFTPVASEDKLVYYQWVAANRKRVDTLSGGRLGYMHIPDMGAPGIYEFIKWYYGQLDKEGLVVDGRANGGGNVSRMIIERLARQWLALGYSRTDSRATTYPDGVFIGPKIALLDEFAGSDGDIFPAMFKQAGLGTLVGMRSWGGVVGIAGRGPLIDGGSISVPEFGFANTKGEWIIEGHGVDPDIPVENDPKAVIEGKDPQLERAVAELMKKIQAQPVKLPPRPAAPIKIEKR
jgi:tricorn protease